jgi:O-antigen ligase
VLAMVAGYVAALLYSRGWQRGVLAFSVPLLFFALLLLTPATIVNRLATLTRDDTSVAEAVESKLGRTELMKRGITATLQNPIFGLGPGQFASVEGSGTYTSGRKGYWMVNHNSFLQISSEAGLPALLFFSISLVAAWKKVANVRMRAILQRHKELEILSLALLLSIVMFSVAAFFLTLAYRLYFPILIGLSVALHIAAERELPQNVQVR